MKSRLDPNPLTGAGIYVGVGGIRAIAASAEPSVDADLVRRARDGAIDAFEQIYRRHAGRVHGLCLRLTGDRQRAEEHTQDTFVRAWQGLGGLRDDHGLGAWLRRIAVNSVLGERRRARRSPVLADRAFDDPAELGSAARTAPGSAVDLERAIGALPARAREVFVLHQVEGYRHDEIAAMLSVTTGTTKAQLHRARKLLTEALR